MQRLATCAEVNVLLPVSVVLLSLAGAPAALDERARGGDSLAPEVDVPVAEPIDAVPAAPLAKYRGACTEAFDFRFPRHIGADGTPDEIVTKTYDAHGRLATLVSRRADAPDRTWTYRYDAAGRLVEELLQAHGRVVNVTAHRYDRAGREIEIGLDEDVDGRVDWLTIKTYDRAGRLATMRENVNAHRPSSGLVNWYFYDGDRLVRREQDIDRDGVPNLATHYTYDANGLLVRAQTRWRDEGMIGDVFEFTYDAHRRIATEMDRYGFTWTYRYDAAGNLIDKTRELPVQALDRAFPDKRITYDYSCWR